MLNLTVTIDPKSGFCFGVKMAITKAEEVLQSGEKLYCLGHIVHNREEVHRLEKMGMITISHDQLPELAGSTVLVRAHGEPPETYRQLEKSGIRLIEASCPVVLKLQDRIRQSHKDGDYILIYGKMEHPEVIGLAGQLPADFQVFQSLEDLDWSTLPQRVTLYSQTTKDPETLIKMADAIENQGIEVNLKDTICRQVSGRKNKLQAFAKEQDVLIMVAGRDSSNGNLLHQRCLEVNPRSYKISSPDDLDPNWFAKNERVGVAGATSTPIWLMEKIAVLIQTY